MSLTENNQQTPVTEVSPTPQAQTNSSIEPPKDVLTYFKVMRILMIIATLLLVLISVVVFTNWKDISPKTELSKDQMIGALVFMAVYIPFLFYVLGQIKKGKKWAILVIIVLYGINLITSLAQLGAGVVVGAGLFAYSLVTYTQNKTYFR